MVYWPPQVSQGNGPRERGKGEGSPTCLPAATRMCHANQGRLKPFKV